MMNKTAAFVTYLLPILGWGYVFFFHRDDKFAVFHTKQAMMIVIVAIVGPLLWAVFGWFVALVPYGGALLVVTMFSLVITLYLVLGIIWIIGMVYALRAKFKPLPLIGHWAERLPFD